MVLFKRFLRDDTGAASIEYTVTATLIAVAVVAGATLIGKSLNTSYADVAKELK